MLSVMCKKSIFEFPVQPEEGIYRKESERWKIKKPRL